MRIHIIAVGTKSPAWVEAGYAEYANRMPADCRLVLHEVPAIKRGKKADVARVRQQEGAKLLDRLPKAATVVALEVGGEAWSTEQLAGRLQRWREAGRDLALLVGGPEGLSEDCRRAAREQWSLSPLTLPHPLVRVVVAEALYRAWSVLHRHPYHRGDASG